jgi:hypothetical protein
MISNYELIEYRNSNKCYHNKKCTYEANVFFNLVINILFVKQSSNEIICHENPYLICLSEFRKGIIRIDRIPPRIM